MASVKGGEKLSRKLDEVGRKLGNPRSVRAGFLEKATYPNGTPVAMVAAIQNFGATIQRQSGQVTIYRKLKKDFTFAKGGKFVKRKVSNFATIHKVGAYTIIIPPRPFFTNMITQNRAKWPDMILALLKRTGGDAAKALQLMGMELAKEIKQSIRDTNEPALAASTIRRKGHTKPLIASGHMFNSVDYEVVEGTQQKDQAG